MTTKQRRAAFNRRPKRKASLRDQMVAIHGRSCWLCGRGIAHGDVISIDHVRPLSKGGSSKIHNLRPAHERCNRKRGNNGVPPLLLSADMRLPTISKSREPTPVEIVGSAELRAATQNNSCNSRRSVLSEMLLVGLRLARPLFQIPRRCLTFHRANVELRAGAGEPLRSTHG